MIAMSFLYICYGNFMLGFWWLWYLSRWLLFAMCTRYCWKHIWNTPNLENSDKFLEDMLFNRIGHIFWIQLCSSKGAVLELVNFLWFFIDICLSNFLEEIDIKYIPAISIVQYTLLWCLMPISLLDQSLTLWHIFGNLQIALDSILINIKTYITTI